jgi:hypothetical protein
MLLFLRFVVVAIARHKCDSGKNELHAQCNVINYLDDAYSANEIRKNKIKIKLKLEWKSGVCVSLCV